MPRMLTTTHPTTPVNGHRLRSRLARPVALLCAAAGATALMTTGILSGVSAPAGAAAHQIAHAASGISGSYIGVTPARIADTRASSGFPDSGQTLGAGSSVNVPVEGVGGVPTSNVSAVVLNVAATNETAASYFTVYPTGTTQPTVASLNFTAGDTVSNLVTVPVGSDGAITIFNYAGSADAVVDVNGYYTTAPNPTGNYVTVNPVRAFGTTSGGSPVAANTSQAVTVTGTATTVPADATAIVANVTASAGTANSYLTVYPAGNAKVPTAANVNFAAGQVIGNRVTIPIGTNGQIEVYNYAGTANVDVDVNGYYTGSASEAGSAFVPITPVRLVDSRSALNGTPIPSNSSEEINFASSGLPTTATALASNITVVAGTAPGYLTAYPTGDATAPVTADVNWPANGVVQNFTNIPLSDATTKFFNSQGAAINVVVDAFGYFGEPLAGVSVSANPSTVPNDGTSTSTITVTSYSGTGTTTSGDTIVLAEIPSVTGACGTLPSPATAVTGSAGTATFKYTASKVAGTCSITATDSTSGLTGSTVITQAPGTTTTGINTVTLTTTTIESGDSPATCSGVPVLGICLGTTIPAAPYTETITAKVANVQGGPLSPTDVVTFSLPASGSDCGKLATASGTPAGTINSSDETTVVYTAAATSGFCPITATESQFGDSATSVIDQTANPAVAATPVVTVTTTKDSIIANGTSTTTINGTVTESGKALASDPIYLYESTTTPGSCGTISAPSTATSSTGTFTATYTSATVQGNCTITAQESEGAAIAATAIGQVGVNLLSSTASPSTLPGDGKSTSTVSVQVATPDFAAVSGDAVTFTVTGGAGCGTVSPTTDDTSSSGEASTTYTAGTGAANCTVTATDGNTGGSAPANIQQSAA
jgi:hypothetical protein